MRCRFVSGVALAAAFFSSGMAFGAEPTYLTPADVNPDLLLPPPPAADSATIRNEVAELHRIQSARTADDLAHARYDAEHEDGWFLATVLGPKFNAKDLPRTAALLEAVRLEAKSASKPAKDHFHHPSPWVVDSTIVGCPHKSDASRATSYPSGHATVGYAAAVVMANLLPARAPDLMHRAQQFAEERLVCGAHFRSDIEGGQVLGTTIGVLLVRDARFQALMSDAKSELAAAGF